MNFVLRIGFKFSETSLCLPVLSLDIFLSVTSGSDNPCLSMRKLLPAPESLLHSETPKSQPLDVGCIYLTHVGYPLAQQNHVVCIGEVL